MKIFKLMWAFGGTAGMGWFMYLNQNRMWRELGDTDFKELYTHAALIWLTLGFVSCVFFSAPFRFLPLGPWAIFFSSQK